MNIIRKIPSVPNSNFLFVGTVQKDFTVVYKYNNPQKSYILILILSRWVYQFNSVSSYFKYKIYIMLNTIWLLVKCCINDILYILL